MWWTTLAWSGPPDVAVRDDHSIVGVVVVNAPPALVRDRIADPKWVAKVDGSGTEVVFVEHRGPCVVSDRASPNAISTVRSRVEQCPTPTGYVESLVASKSFDSYRVLWTFEPDGAGTRITYDLAMSTSMMVPQFVIDQQARKGVHSMLTQLQVAFADPATP